MKNRKQVNTYLTYCQLFHLFTYSTKAVDYECPGVSPDMISITILFPLSSLHALLLLASTNTIDELTDWHRIPLVQVIVIRGCCRFKIFLWIDRVWLADWLTEMPLTHNIISLRDILRYQPPSMPNTHSSPQLYTWGCLSLFAEWQLHLLHKWMSNCVELIQLYISMFESNKISQLFTPTGYWDHANLILGISNNWEEKHLHV